ncbi:MAG: hypothetical protein ACYDC1_19675, partial [Limisphaerales bacterium]
LDHGKRHELTAPGWVADVTRLESALGLACTTTLAEGIRQTLAWYRREGWIRPARPGVDDHD